MSVYRRMVQLNWTNEKYKFYKWEQMQYGYILGWKLVWLWFHYAMNFSDNFKRFFNGNDE